MWYLLCNLPQLQTLALFKCNGLNDRALAFLPSSASRTTSRLQSLDLESCEWVCDEVLRDLCLPDLRHLSLYRGSRITDAGLEALARLQQLECLHLSGCDQVTDTGMANLSALPKLVNVRLHGTNLKFRDPKWNSVPDDPCEHDDPFFPYDQRGLNTRCCFTRLSPAGVSRFPAELTQS
eukprot:g78782.t1